MYKLFGKKTIDLLIVIISFVFLLPVLVFISILIKVFDSGPVIFTQKRVGKDGKYFDFYKFRSMPVNTGDIPSDKIEGIKLTWIGNFIRRTNLDELPQLFNIIKGDMSIVGPRPPIPSQLDLIAFRNDNCAIKLLPGLTGLAQISSYDGMSVEEKAFFDGKYAENISFYTDINIMFKTFFYLLKSPPKY